MGYNVNNVPVVDLHEDVSAYFLLHGGGAPLGDFGEDIPGRDADIPKYLRGNVRCVFASMFLGIETFRPGESKALEKLYGRWLPAVGYRVPQSLLLEHVSIYHKISEAYGVKLVENVDDVERCLRADGLCFILHIEGAEVLDEPYDLILLKKLGLRAIGLTWNYMNKYGTGCNAKKDVGLTSEGEELVRTANRLGVLVDLAHASRKTALETMEVSKKPVMISHANVRGIVDTPRNVDDEVLEALHRNGGVMGMSVIGPLIAKKPRPSLEDLAQHFIYVHERFGPDVMAIGTDFLGLLGLPTPEGLESVDKIPTLLRKLEEKGLSDGDLVKIAHENVLRVLRANML